MYKLQYKKLKTCGILRKSVSSSGSTPRTGQKKSSEACRISAGNQGVVKTVFNGSLVYIYAHDLEYKHKDITLESAKDTASMLLKPGSCVFYDSIVETGCIITGFLTRIIIIEF